MLNRIRKQALFTCTLVYTLALSACVSHEPAILVPTLNLSAEDISLSTMDQSSKIIDFGLELALNESDSLSNIEVLPGVRVRGVSSNGAADVAGIQLGDIILSINGTLVNHPDVVMALQQDAMTAESFLFTVRRNTVVFEATVIPRAIANNPAPKELYRVDPIASRAAYRTEMVQIQEQPAVAAAKLVEVFPESPLAAANIKPGDLILAVNSVPLNSAQDLVTRLNTEFELGERVSLTVYNGHTVHDSQLNLWNPGRRISEFSLGPLLRYKSSLASRSSRFSLLDLWLFSFYSYSRVEEERRHSILGLINFGSDLGALVEEEN
jgi:membrane-associated protease RseP (regulator of RpoE activity)